MSPPHLHLRNLHDQHSRDIDLHLWNSHDQHNRDIDLHLWNLHDKHNKDTGHRVNEQLRNLHDFLDSRDHEDEPLRHDRDVGDLRVRDDFLHELQLWERDCLLHNLHLWNSHDQQNMDIDHLVEGKLGNLFGLKDHGKPPLLHDR